ncbi:MAG: hypothetical protein M3487_05250 [Actinomycetota bacterium]|nr:hypothetical protein [Actinomycetota bacterium]
MRKQRLTVSIDPDLAAAATAAVNEGRAESVSSWVSDAIADRAARDRRLRALASAVAAYEAEHGRIDTAELAEQARADRDAAAAVRADASRRSGVT